MIGGLRYKRLNMGQIRLLCLIASKYKVEPEDVLNRIVQDYNELHLEAVLNKTAYDAIPGRSLGVVEVGDALARKTEREFKRSLRAIKHPTIKQAKEQQVQTIEEGLNALYRS